MKIALITSIILNVLLVGQMLFKEEERPVVEKVVIADFPDERPNLPASEEKKIPVKQTTEKKKKSSKTQIDENLDVPLPHDVTEFDHLSEQMENQRRDYFINQLQIPEEKLQKQEQIRNDYFSQTSKIFEKNPTELSINDRRKLLDYEEEYQKKLLDLYGKETWEKMEKWRESYNEQILKRMREENVPAVLMAP